MYESSRGPLKGAVLAQKALQGYEMETMELPEGKEENSVSPMRGHLICPTGKLIIFYLSGPPNIWLLVTLPLNELYKFSDHSLMSNQSNTGPEWRGYPPSSLSNTPADSWTSSQTPLNRRRWGRYPTSTTHMPDPTSSTQQARSTQTQTSFKIESGLPCYSSWKCENITLQKNRKLARRFPRFERLVHVTMIIFLIKIEVVISRKKLLVPQRPPGE